MVELFDCDKSFKLNVLFVLPNMFYQQLTQKCLSIMLQVMVEADRILNMDFEQEVDKILKSIPRERRTFLFSATMTKKVQKLQRASLKDPVKVEVSSKYQTVDKLQQFYVFIPVKYKVNHGTPHLFHNINDMRGQEYGYGL